MTEYINYDFSDLSDLYSIFSSEKNSEETILEKIDKALQYYNTETINSFISNTSTYNIFKESSKKEFDIDYSDICENLKFPIHSHLFKNEKECDEICCENFEDQEDEIFKNAYDSNGLFKEELIEDSSVTSDDILDLYYIDAEASKEKYYKKLIKKMKACMGAKVFTSKNISSFLKK
jgi:hypothetical protein